MSTAVPLRAQLRGHGFSWRKRALARAFTARPDLRFVRSGRQVPPDGDLLLWGSAPVPAGVPDSVRIVRLEDGFLRSVGLGADLVRPLSWVVDDLGIYYDASRPSRLEQLLQHRAFDDALRARARGLREALVQAGLTKYNLVAARPWQRPAQATHVVLVPGQVETDASIRTGTGAVRTNLGLLRAVRAARPGAWIVYKPHPDVVAGLRRPGSDEAQAAAFCDEVLAEGAMHDLLQKVDEVHVLTSLAGFEALLRGVPVTCHGTPFYAGWGLTQDEPAHPRRTRRLALDELVAGALLLYPTYLSRATGLPCPPEQAVEELLAWRAAAPHGLPWWRRWLRPLLARP